MTPQALAKTFGDPTYVATDVPYRTQAEWMRRQRLWLMRWPARSLNSKARRGGIRSCGPEQRGKHRCAGGTVRREVHDHHIPHRFDPLTGYTTSFSVTGRRDRTLLGLASSGCGKAPDAIVIGQVSDAADPEKAGRVKLTFPWLADYVATGRVRCSRGRARTAVGRWSRGR